MFDEQDGSMAIYCHAKPLQSETVVVTNRHTKLVFHEYVYQRLPDHHSLPLAM